MGFDFSKFQDEGLNESFVDWLVDEQWAEINSHFGRLWEYYQNQMRPVFGMRAAGGMINEAGRNYVQGQETGLPPRITGIAYSGSGEIADGRRIGDIQRKEVVIENDIAWRINAMVDFLFGKGVNIVSKAPQTDRRREIEQILKAVFTANGGLCFFQDMAVLGSVYGFVDCIIRPGRHFQNQVQQGKPLSNSEHTFGTSRPSFESVLRAASTIGLELIEAPRALPVLDENDYRKISYYVQHFYQQKNRLGNEPGFLARLLGARACRAKREITAVTEIIGSGFRQRYENKQLVDEEINLLGVVPVVHMQNLAQPYYYEGLSDVEQLIGLQDELNTRLSDRASRITFQAFKMYLAKGVEGIEDKPVSPGRMWFTDNPQATIEEFGGDGAMPSEDVHISEIRDAMDKVSGVTPVVAGVLKNKIGNLTSGVALKMTFMGMLAKTARKQFTYGQGIKQICSVVLEALDKFGDYRTDLAEREVEVIFPNPLPEDSLEKLKEAQAKIELGVPRQKIISELGYDIDE